MRTSAPPPRRLHGSWLQRAAGSAAIALALLLALEGIARLLPARLTLTREALLRDWLGEGVLLASDAVPGWDLAPEGGVHVGVPYQTDAWRMRGPPLPSWRGPRDQRVIFVGDSSVFGHGLRWDETFIAGFERLREASNPGWDVQTGACAVPGHSTVQSLLKLERQCLASRPDLVVIANQYSDSTMTFLSDAERFNLEPPNPASHLAERLASYRLLRNYVARRFIFKDRPAAELINQVGLNLPGNVPRVAVPAYKDNLATMIARTRAAGATPVLLVLAALSDVDHKERVRHYPPYREAMRALATEQGVLLIDVPPRFAQHPGESDLFMDKVHPSASGAALLAELLNEQLPPPSKR